MRILIVDDQKTTGLVLSQILKAHGHDTRLITSGADAWDAIAREDWRLILTDRVMPDVDGLELCRRIRRRVADPYRYVMIVANGVRVDADHPGEPGLAARAALVVERIADGLQIMAGHSAAIAGTLLAADVKN
jgi:CheY-like chemotaxis protein